MDSSPFLNLLKRGSNIAGVAALVLLCVHLYAAFFVAPEEAVQGAIQRIFYVHVPAAVNAFAAFIVAGIGSVAYLWKRSRAWDMTAAAAAEVGVFWGAIVLITGPLWAKPVWGAWWTWDARLTSTLILWLTFVAYRLVRELAGGGEKGARFAAILAIVGTLNIPFVKISTEKFRTLHPGNVAKAGLDPTMHKVLFLGMGTFFLFTLFLLGKRILLEELRDERLAIELEGS